jgi:putative oxidoreductase
MFKTYPFISLRQALTAARIVTAVLFMAHAVVRIVNGSIPQFGKFMTSVGFPQGEAVVWAITVVEIAAGTMLIVNRCVRVAATALFAIAAIGIVLIHRHIGWFVGEHGTGGSEYSVALIILLIVIAAADRPAPTEL